MKILLSILLILSHMKYEYILKNVKIKIIRNTIIKKDTPLHMPPSKTLRYTKFEDIEFEKKFDVFTGDEVEARYLITPSFMERLKGKKLKMISFS